MTMRDHQLGEIMQPHPFAIHHVVTHHHVED